MVKEVEEEREAPCKKKLAEGMPCFPITTEVRGPRYSVRDSLRDLGKGKAPSRPPTVGELQPYLSGAITPTSPGIGFDPGCVGKSVLKALKGKNDAYFLYRVRDAHGERVALYDHRIEPGTFQGDLEFLGKYEGECEALAAFRREERRTPSAAPASPPP